MRHSLLPRDPAPGLRGTQQKGGENGTSQAEILSVGLLSCSPAVPIRIASQNGNLDTHIFIELIRPNDISRDVTPKKNAKQKVMSRKRASVPVRGILAPSAALRPMVVPESAPDVPHDQMCILAVRRERELELLIPELSNAPGGHRGQIPE